MSPHTSPERSAGRRLASHGLTYVVGTALQGLALLAVTPFVTRTLSQAEYGRVSTALVAIQLFGTVAAAGLPQVIMRQHHHLGDDGVGARALSAVMVAMAAALALVGGAVWAAAPGSASGGRELVGVALVGAGALTGVVAGQSVMRAQQRPGAFLATAVLSTAAAQGAGLLAAMAERTALSFLTAYAAVVTLSALVAAVLARPVWPGRARSAVRHGLRLALPLLPHAVAMLVLLMGDVLVVAWLLGAESVATYQVALMLGNMPFVLVTALANAWAPAVLSHLKPDRWRWAERTGVLLALVVAVAGVGVALLAPWLGAVAAPRTFDIATIVVLVALMTSVAPAYLLYNGSSLALIDGEATGRLAWAAVGAALVMLGLATGAAVLVGLAGVAVARLAGYLALAGACAVLARKYGLAWRPVDLLGLTLMTGGLGVAAGAGLPVEGSGAVVRLVLVAILVAVCAVAAWRARGLVTTSGASRIASGDSPANL